MNREMRQEERMKVKKIYKSVELQEGIGMSKRMKKAKYRRRKPSRPKEKIAEDLLCIKVALADPRCLGGQEQVSFELFQDRKFELEQESREQ